MSTDIGITERSGQVYHIPRRLPQRAIFKQETQGSTIVTGETIVQRVFGQDLKEREEKLKQGRLKRLSISANKQMKMNTEPHIQSKLWRI